MCNIPQLRKALRASQTMSSLLLFLLLSLQLSISSTNRTAREDSFLPATEGEYWVALGDSYAAGVGAGHRISRDCERYDLAYPFQLNEVLNGWGYGERFGSDEFIALSSERLASSTISTTSRTTSSTSQLPDTRLQPPKSNASSNNSTSSSPKTNLTSLACAGARIPAFIIDQAPYVRNATFATLTIGGNDAGFFRVINACIFRFNGYGSGDCDEEISKAGWLVEYVVPGYLREGLDAILEAVADKDGGEEGDSEGKEDGRRDGKKKKRFKLYITGYAKFFNEETTQCNIISFDYWKLSGRIFLTREVRRRINLLVSLLNQKIESAAQGMEGVEFVGIDGGFEGHRFCEVGV